MPPPPRARAAGPLAVALFAWACSPVGYDFGAAPVEDDPAERACLALPLSETGCLDEVAVCDYGVEVAVDVIDVPLGCTPEGLALGVAWIDGRPGQAAMDLFAWVEPAPGDHGIFAPGAALALFAEKCDKPLGGAPGMNCSLEPHLWAPALSLDQPLFLHVQRPAPGQAALGLQVVERDWWRAALPAAGEPLSCRLADSEVLSDLVAAPPWDGSPAVVDAARLPPPLDGRPWMCGQAAAGWRQVAFLLRNQGDAALVITAIRLAAAGRQGAAPFHYGLYRCGNDAVVLEPGPLAASCHDAGDHATKEPDVRLEPWIPDRADTEYALVLQVPPGPDRLFELSIDSASPPW